jgi:hypothetical protein
LGPGGDVEHQLSAPAQSGADGEPRGGTKLTRHEPDAAIPCPLKLKDGHYTGTTEQDEPISFDVIVGGAALTNLTFMVKASCSSDGQTIVDEPITVTGLFPIGLNGNFSDTVRGTDTEAVIDGTATSSSSTRGSLRVELVIPCGESNVVYSTGEVGWTAQAS